MLISRRERIPPSTPETVVGYGGLSSTQPRFKNVSNAYLAFLAFSILLAFTLSGCQSPQEKKGVSKIPQNRPAKWEQGNYGPGVNF